MFYTKRKLLNRRQAGTTAALVLAFLLVAGKALAADDQKISSSTSATVLFEHNLQPLVHVRGTKGQQTLTERMAYYHIPGVSIAVVHNGMIDWAKGYGLIKAGAQKQVTPTTYFEAASISKPITVLTTMVFAQRGAIDLDAPVNNCLKSWRVPSSTFSASSPLTIREIMCHHGGFNVEFVTGYTKGDEIPLLVEVLNGSPPSNNAAVKVIETPGQNFRYSAGGFLVLQQALMDLGHQDFEALADGTLFQPLGMRGSTFHQPPLTGQTSDIARGHGFDGTPTARRIYPELSAAGLRTTPTDLCLAILELQGALDGHGKLLQKKSAEQILTAHGEKPKIGLGLFLAGKDSTRRFSMDGWNYGFTCRMVGFAEKGDGAAVMTNGDNGALMFEVLDAIGKAYDWPVQPMKCKEALPISPHVAQKFAAHYSWESGMQAEVIILDSRMFLHVFHEDKKIMDPFPPAELFAKSESAYFSVFPPMSVRFDTDTKDQVSALIYTMAGKEIRATRLP